MKRTSHQLPAESLSYSLLQFQVQVWTGGPSNWRALPHNENLGDPDLEANVGAENNPQNKKYKRFRKALKQRIPPHKLSALKEEHSLVEEELSACLPLIPTFIDKNQATPRLGEEYQVGNNRIIPSPNYTLCRV